MYIHTHTHIYTTIHGSYMYIEGVLTVIPYQQKGHKCYDKSGFLLQIRSYIYMYIYMYIPLRISFKDRRICRVTNFAAFDIQPSTEDKNESITCLLHVVAV